MGSQPRVYFEEWDDPLISGIQWVEELIEIAGGEPVFPDCVAPKLARDRIVSSEQVMAAAPEIIIGSWCGKPVRAAKIAARPGWIGCQRSGTVTSTRSNRSYILQPGPAAFTEGVQQLHRILVTVATRRGGVFRYRERVIIERAQWSFVSVPLSVSPRAGGVGSGGRATITCQLGRHGIELSGDQRRAAHRQSAVSPPDRAPNLTAAGTGRPDPLAAVELIDIRARDHGRRRPGDLRLLLRIELVDADQRRRVDLVLRQELARLEPEDVDPARDLDA